MKNLLVITSLLFALFACDSGTDTSVEEALSDCEVNKTGIVNLNNVGYDQVNTSDIPFEDIDVIVVKLPDGTITELDASETTFVAPAGTIQIGLIWKIIDGSNLPCNHWADLEVTVTTCSELTLDVAPTYYKSPNHYSDGQLPDYFSEFMKWVDVD